MLCKMKDITYPLYDPFFYQLIDEVKAKADDIQPAFRDEMGEILLDSGWTGDISAEFGCLAGDASDCCVAMRTLRWHYKESLSAAAKINQRTYDLGDHVSCPLHHYTVTDADILSPYFVFIVKSSMRDLHPTYANRF